MRTPPFSPNGAIVAEPSVAGVWARQSCLVSMSRVGKKEQGPHTRPLFRIKERSYQGPGLKPQPAELMKGTVALKPSWVE